MNDSYTSTLTLARSRRPWPPASGTMPILTFNTAAANGTSDVLAITGAGTVGAGKAQVNIVPLANPSASTNKYTVITASSGMTPGNFAIGNTNVNVGGTVYHFVADASSSATRKFESGLRRADPDGCLLAGKHRQGVGNRKT